MFLLDTDEQSARRRRERNPKAVKLAGIPENLGLYLSVVTIGEIERGIRQQQQRDPTFARELARWRDRVLAWYGDRMLPVNSLTVRWWRHLSAALGHACADLLIAPPALEHDLMVVTRNVRHFQLTGVIVFNPFNGLGTALA